MTYVNSYLYQCPLYSFDDGNKLPQAKMLFGSNLNLIAPMALSPTSPTVCGNQRFLNFPTKKMSNYNNLNVTTKETCNLRDGGILNHRVLIFLRVLFPKK